VSRFALLLLLAAPVWTASAALIPAPRSLRPGAGELSLPRQLAARALPHTPADRLAVDTPREEPGLTEEQLELVVRTLASFRMNMPTLSMEQAFRELYKNAWLAANHPHWLDMLTNEIPPPAQPGLVLPE
jgi:hypothetical protein